MLRNAFSWKFNTHPPPLPPRNANNVEPYTSVTLFPGILTPSHPIALRNSSMTPYIIISRVQYIIMELNVYIACDSDVMQHLYHQQANRKWHTHESIIPGTIITGNKTITWSLLGPCFDGGTGPLMGASCTMDPSVCICGRDLLVMVSDLLVWVSDPP